MRGERPDHGSVHGYGRHTPRNPKGFVYLQMRVWMDVKEAWGPWQHTNKDRLRRLHFRKRPRSADILECVIAGGTMTSTVDGVLRQWRRAP
ncbi:MAG: hypothetical protein V3T22_10380 [Planctomycetota bacterium]